MNMGHRLSLCEDDHAVNSRDDGNDVSEPFASEFARGEAANDTGNCGDTSIGFATTASVGIIGDCSMSNGSLIMTEGRLPPTRGLRDQLQSHTHRSVNGMGAHSSGGKGGCAYLNAITYGNSL